jgi:hypothetical protein
MFASIPTHMTSDSSVAQRSIEFPSSENACIDACIDALSFIADSTAITPVVVFDSSQVAQNDKIQLADATEVENSTISSQVNLKIT